MQYRPDLSYRLLAAFLLAVMSIGCVTETHDGDTTIFKFETWVPISVVLGGVVAFVVGIFLRSTRWGWVLMIVGPICTILAGPGMFLDKVTVNKDRFTLHTGFWFAPTVHNVEFAGLSGIDLIAEEKTVRGGKRKSYFLLCRRSSGQNEKVPIGDLMKEGAVERIVDAARSRGIPVTDKS